MEMQIANGTVLGEITESVFIHLHFSSVLTSAFNFLSVFFIEIKQWETTLLPVSAIKALKQEISKAYGPNILIFPFQELLTELDNGKK